VVAASPSIKGWQAITAMSKSESKGNLPAYAVLLAGGRGTRFWPRSRMHTPKQLLNIVGSQTMLRQTWDRLSPLFPADRIAVVTNSEQAEAVRKELKHIPAERILAEPTGRNTAAAIGLAAIHLAHTHGDALMAVLPADHFIAKVTKYRRLVESALELAREPGTLVVMGIPPSHPETGFGYIERARTAAARIGGIPVYEVRRFTEKPPAHVARKYVASGRYYWNAGMFFWRASTFLECVAAFLPKTRAALAKISAAIGTNSYDAVLGKYYQQLEDISVDCAVMERATQKAKLTDRYRVLVLPMKVEWSDIGSWNAVYDLLAKQDGANVSAGPSLGLDASGNFFWSPKKFVAAIGVHDLVVVETDDALLICTRDRAQDVGKVVKWLEKKCRTALL
jgi:mannose-1-phosphate guanylyltransferase